MELTSLATTAVLGAASAAGLGALSVRIRHLNYRGWRLAYLVIWFGGSLITLAVLAIVVCAILVAAGMTFVSGTEVLEAAVYTVGFSGIVAGAYGVVGRSRATHTQPVITTEERLAAARATALLASEGQLQRLEGALQLEALAQARTNLVTLATQALTGLVSCSRTDASPPSRYVALTAIQALSRLNLFLREQGSTLDLPFASLATLDLSGLDLRGANLAGADLSHSVLAGTDLTGANLTGARLDGADLSQADLAYAYMQEASLDHAILAGAHLEGTYLPSIGQALR